MALQASIRGDGGQEGGSWRAGWGWVWGAGNEGDWGRGMQQAHSASNMAELLTGSQGNSDKSILLHRLGAVEGYPQPGLEPGVHSNRITEAIGMNVRLQLAGQAAISHACMKTIWDASKVSARRKEVLGRTTTEEIG